MTIKEREMHPPKLNLGGTLESTFKEIDKRLSILDKFTVEWIKGMIMWHASDGFIRGYDIAKQLKEEE